MKNKNLKFIFESIVIDHTGYAAKSINQSSPAIALSGEFHKQSLERFCLPLLLSFFICSCTGVMTSWFLALIETRKKYVP